MYEEKASSEGSNLPRLVCVITGKGAQKDRYLKLISEKKWEKVAIATPWLEAEDYPKLLGTVVYSKSMLDTLVVRVVQHTACNIAYAAVGHCQNCV